jgi:hypothetical protein
MAEGTSRMPILPVPLGAFQPPKPAYRILLRYPPDGHGYIFSCAVIIFHPQVCARSLNSGFKVFELGIDDANGVDGGAWGFTPGLNRLRKKVEQGAKPVPSAAKAEQIFNHLRTA